MKRIRGAPLAIWLCCLGMPATARAQSCTVTVTDFGAAGDGTTDDTAAIQGGIDSLNLTDFPSGGGGIVCFPTGQFLITQITLRAGVSLYGTGIGSSGKNGTLIVQKGGVNKSAIVNNAASLPPMDYWHWTEIRNMQVVKAAGSSDTSGSGIEANCRTGEGFKIDHVLVQNFPQHGISLLRGGAPLYLEDLHVSGNGIYGLNIARTGQDSWNMVQISVVSGDDNGTALVGIDTAGAKGESFWLTGLKAEVSTSGRQPYVVDIRNTNAAPIFIRNVSAAGAGGSGIAIVRNSSSMARLHLEAIAASNFSHVISDTFGSRTVDSFNFFSLVYNATGEVSRGTW